MTTNRIPYRRLFEFHAAALVLLAAVAVAQPPPGVESSVPQPKLSLRELIGGTSAGGGDSGQVNFTAFYNLDKESRKGTLTVSAVIDPGWHIYSLTQPPGGPGKSEIKLAKTTDVTLLGPFQPDHPPHVIPPSVFPVNSEEHEGIVNWTAPIQLSEGAQPESRTIELIYNGQVCKDGVGGVCIPIFDQKVSAKFSGYREKSATPGEYHPGPSQAELVLKGHIEPAAVARGGKAKLVLTAVPNPGWHVYAHATKDPDVVGANKPTLIYLSLPAGWKQSPVKASAKPKVTPAKGIIPEQTYHEEPVTWTIDLTVPADAPQGEVVLSGYVGFQTCDEKSCLPPQTVEFRAGLPVRVATQSGQIPLDFKPVDRVKVSETKTVAGYNHVANLVAENPSRNTAVDWKALLPMVGFGLLGGLILNLMPCVLPVIGLKLLSFAQQGGQSRGKIFALNVWFAAGLLVVFLALATLAAFGSLLPFLGQNLSWGQQFTFTSFKVAMVVVVFAFALSFLGVWEVPIPGFAQTTSSSKLQQQEGPAGAFFKGIFTTLLATPCSGPFLGSVFGFTLTQPPLVTYVLFTSVGLGMASPYLIIGAFPGLIKWLPKPGEWMETVKQLMGFVLLGTVVFLFGTLNKDYFVPTLAVVMAVWLGCWIIGRVPIYEDLGKQLRQWAFGVATAAAIGWLSFTLLSPRKHLFDWQPYTPETIAKLQSEGKTVMVDFTANWCATCQTNFIFVINTKEVKYVVEKNGIVPLLADWSDRNETIKSNLEELKSNSIPLLAIYPANKPGEVILLRDAITQQQLLTALNEAGPSLGPEPEKHQVSTANIPTESHNQ